MDSKKKKGFGMISPEDVAKLTFSYFFARAVFIITVWTVFTALFVGAACVSLVYLEYKIEHASSQTFNK